jgi:hypothetical protein
MMTRPLLWFVDVAVAHVWACALVLIAIAKSARRIRRFIGWLTPEISCEQSESD